MYKIIIMQVLVTLTVKKKSGRVKCDMYIAESYFDGARSYHIWCKTVVDIEI